MTTVGRCSTHFSPTWPTSGGSCGFKGYPYRYVTVDDHDYWTTQASGTGGTIINRKPSADAGWDPE